MKTVSTAVSLARVAVLGFIAAGTLSVWAQPLPFAAPADVRVGVPEVRVTVERADWTYPLGAQARFRVNLDVDRRALGGAKVRYQVGPEMMPAAEREAETDANGLLLIDGGTLTAPGFIRCIVTHERAGRTYRGSATAGFAPEKIQPTQTEPADFDAFWTSGRAALAAIPLDARITPMPEAGTAGVDVYHVSFQNVSVTEGGPPTRIYGILCEPKGPGPFPALLQLPGANVRPFTGQRELAERGFITLEIGIHGIPVNLPPEIYSQLYLGALNNYGTLHLDNRDRYYYRRVYLGCVRANDFLLSRLRVDPRRLGVTGFSQGGQLSIVTAALDSRVRALAATYPAYCDVTGYLHGRAGGWPHMFRLEQDGHRTHAKIATTGYFDTVNFARRLKVPGSYAWGYNDEICPPTTMFAAYNVITAPKRLALLLELGHTALPAELTEDTRAWLAESLDLR